MTKFILNHDGITNNRRTVFITCQNCHNRPLNELPNQTIQPVKTNLKQPTGIFLLTSRFNSISNQSAYHLNNIPLAECKNDKSIQLRALQTMNEPILDAVVIGAGHSGLCISYNLKQLGLRHLLFEQNKIGHSWTAQRWDTFKLNTPNKVNLLPGTKNRFSNPDGFCSAKEFAAYLADYSRSLDLPVMEKTKVLSVSKTSDSNNFLVAVFHDGKEKKYLSKNVVVASGSQNQKIIPAFASDLSSDIRQMHASEYRNGDALPQGAIMVVGSGQSGLQIAEDLTDMGRKVYLSTSKVGRVPRRYRGKDILDWLSLSGFNDHRPEDLPNPEMLKMKQPQISGVGPLGKTISLQSLAAKGAVILGKMKNAAGDRIDIEPNAGEHIKFADALSKNIKDLVDAFIDNSGMEAPPAEADPADLPDENADCASNETLLDLKEHNITTVIWATGFAGDFSYLKLPVFKDDGALNHKNGISEIKGLYFLGFPWLRKRKSGIVLGIEEDAKFISAQLSRH